MEKINFVNGSTPALSAANLNQLQKNIEKALLAMKPVGSIEINTTGVNPSTYIGGTWKAWGSGRVPVGIDTAQTEFATVEKTGGEKTHKLTVNEMPSHNHAIQTKYNQTSFGTNVEMTRGAGGTYELKDTVIEYAGGSQAHNNLQPYITCYMWKRTA